MTSGSRLTTDCFIKAFYNVEACDSNQSVAGPSLLRRAGDPGAAGVGDIIRIEPRSADPAVLVVFGEALLRERDHPIERARGARAPHRLDADVLVVAGVVPLVELMAPAELAADRIPEKLHHLDALLVVDAVRAAH